MQEVICEKRGNATEFMGVALVPGATISCQLVSSALCLDFRFEISDLLPKTSKAISIRRRPVEWRPLRRVVHASQNTDKCKDVIDATLAADKSCAHCKGTESSNYNLPWVTSPTLRKRGTREGTRKRLPISGSLIEPRRSRPT